MLRYMKILLSILVTVTYVIGFVRADCPTADLNGDCRVDSRDVNILAQQWLQPSGQCTDANWADLDGVDGVNMVDFTLLADDWGQIGIPLFINEFMASNNSVIRDTQGEYDDWIELYNSGPESIDVSGMYMTDDLDRPTMWRIPSTVRGKTMIPSKGYLLICLCS